MFIENLRNVKDKRRVLIGVLLGLIILSLLLTFAYFGSDIGVSADNGSTGDFLKDAENAAKIAGDVADKSDDMEAQNEAASAYFALAGYQVLHLEDATKSYKKALKYAEAMVAACGSAEAPDYETAYGYEIKAYAGLKDAQGLSAAFNESLEFVELNQSYLSTYNTAMTELDAQEQFIADMETVTAKLQEQAKAEPKADDEDAEESTEMSASQLIDYVASLVAAAQGTSAPADAEPIVIE